MLGTETAFKNRMLPHLLLLLLMMMMMMMMMMVMLHERV